MSGRARIVARKCETHKKLSPSRICQADHSQSLHSPVDNILFLQKTVGNKAVQRLVKSGGIQTKLKIGQPGDIYERAADYVADKVRRMAETKTRRKPRNEEEEELVQTRPITEQNTPLVQRQVEEDAEKISEAKIKEMAGLWMLDLLFRLHKNPTEREMIDRELINKKEKLSKEMGFNYDKLTNAILLVQFGETDKDFAKDNPELRGDMSAYATWKIVNKWNGLSMDALLERFKAQNNKADSLRIDYSSLTNPTDKFTHIAEWSKLNINRIVLAMYVVLYQRIPELKDGKAHKGLKSLLKHGQYRDQILAICKLCSLSNSVGKNGTNNESDVLLIQILLKKEGFLKSSINGKADAKTIDAIIKLQNKGLKGVTDFDKAVKERKETIGLIKKDSITWNRLFTGDILWTPPKVELSTIERPTQRALESASGKKIYGRPCDTSNLETIGLPFNLIFQGKEVGKATVHKVVAKSLNNALQGVLDHYGDEGINELRINHYYGGAYICKNIGSTGRRSMHSWGLAIDLNAQENGKNVGANKALFAKPKYKALLDIMERHGWYNLGRYSNRDYMHFQAVKI